MAVFDNLFSLNVNDHTEKKKDLTYLSWAWAWAEVKKAYPDANYVIWKDERNLPYVYDSLTGYMVYTSVTIEGVTHDMWLPVMDGANKAMKAEPYQYEGNEYINGKRQKVLKTVQPATMFDINTAIMRCLTKNLAMFGLGLYIYAGEDIPAGDDAPSNNTNADVSASTKPKQAGKNTKSNNKPSAGKKADNGQNTKPEVDDVARVKAYLARHADVDVSKLCKAFNIESIDALSLDHARYYISKLTENGGCIDE